MPYKPNPDSKRTTRRKKRNSGQLLPGRAHRRGEARLQARIRDHKAKHSADSSYRMPGSRKCW